MFCWMYILFINWKKNYQMCWLFNLAVSYLSSYRYFIRLFHPSSFYFFVFVISNTIETIFNELVKIKIQRNNTDSLKDWSISLHNANCKICHFFFTFWLRYLSFYITHFRLCFHTNYYKPASYCLLVLWYGS